MENDQNSDTIQVRLDEQFDVEKLAAYLHERLPGATHSPLVRQFGGGAANLTYLLDYGTHQYVLRRPPLGPVARSAHDMGREFKVLSVLHQVFPYAPRAFLYCDDPSIIGAVFFVMERRQGVVVRRSMPPEFAALPDAPRQLSAALVDALAEFHAVNYHSIGLGSLGEPDGFITRQIEGWYKRWHAARTGEVTDMETVYQWLRSHQPPASVYSLVHNDYKLDNIMFDSSDPGKMVAVFDWDMCTLGDPLNDLGALLSYWTEPTDPPYYQGMAMMPSGLDFMTRRELVDRYSRKSGRSIHDIHFYHALGLFRVTVIIAQIYIRYHRGQTKDQRFAAFGKMIPLMARAALEVALTDQGESK
jgi:aminoglycoside phosphotransferase (APT) family kinase protein